MAEQQIILGTAGHIDHGKTSLIKAVTGINTDRLKEEQERGITIELGFAAIDLPSGRHIGVVDVPGHEKFVKNMVAGATGIDMVAMVIAADEGVMPQTKEHLEICSLLNIKHGLVVMTKIDMVDEEWLELVTEDIREFTEGTFLEGKPVVPVSSSTGQGIKEFIVTLDKISGKIPQRTSSSLFRLPVDRVFSMKGFGTVITGTLVSGKIRTGETIMIYPSEIRSKVRGIQVHNLSVEEAGAGMRTAINFQGLDKASVDRGDVLANPDALRPAYMIDASFNYLAGNRKPMKSRTRVRFHSGTSEVQGIIVLLDREEVKPGETVSVQFRFDAPVVQVRDDRYVIRSYSPVRTIGGGFIINPVPVKHKRFKADIIERLDRLAETEPDEMILLHALNAGFAGVMFSDLKIMTNMAEKPLNSVLQQLFSKKKLVRIDKEKQIYLHHEIMDILKDKCENILASYHKKNPLKPGMPKEELRSKFPIGLNAKAVFAVISQMEKEDKIVQKEDIIWMFGHKVALGTDYSGAKKKVLELYSKSGLTPPYVKDVSKTLDIDESVAADVLRLLIEEKSIIKAKEKLYFCADAIGSLQKKLVGFFSSHEEMSAPQFKEMTGLSRKYLIPLLEYFDSINLTIRVGDIRKIRRSR